MSTSNMVDIATACSRRGIVNVVGVVVDKMPMRQFKNSSPCVTFTIKDTDLDAPHWQGGLKIRYFNEYPNVLPDPKVNDVVILRGVRVGHFRRCRLEESLKVNLGQHVQRKAHRNG